MAKRIMSKDENLHSFSTRKTIFFRSPSPSALMICGFMAFMMAEDRMESAVNT